MKIANIIEKITFYFILSNRKTFNFNKTLKSNNKSLPNCELKMYQRYHLLVLIAFFVVFRTANALPPYLLNNLDDAKESNDNKDAIQTAQNEDDEGKALSLIGGKIEHIFDEADTMDENRGIAYKLPNDEISAEG